MLTWSATSPASARRRAPALGVRAAAWSSRVAGGGAVLLYAGLGALLGRPDDHLGRRPRRAAHRGRSTTWCSAPFVVPAGRSRRRSPTGAETRAAGACADGASTMSRAVAAAAGRAAGAGAVAAGHPARPALVRAGRRRRELQDGRGREPHPRDHHAGRPRHDPRLARPAAGPQPHRAGRLGQPDRAAPAARRRPRAGRQGRRACIGEPADDVWDRTRLCGSPGAPPAAALLRTARRTSRSRSPTRPSTEMALQIMERREDFPGVTRRAHRGPRVPAAARAPTPRTMLGYLGPVTDDELAAASRRTPAGREERDRAAAHRPDRPRRARGAVRRRAARHAGGQDRWRSTTRAASAACSAETAADRRQLPRDHASTRRSRPRPRSSCKAAIMRARQHR